MNSISPLQKHHFHSSGLIKPLSTLRIIPHQNVDGIFTNGYNYGKSIQGHVDATEVAENLQGEKDTGNIRVETIRPVNLTIRQVLCRCATAIAVWCTYRNAAPSNDTFNCESAKVQAHHPLHVCTSKNQAGNTKIQRFVWQKFARRHVRNKKV